MKTLIYGNGAMARVLYSYVRTDRDVVGFTVDEVCLEPGTKQFCGLPIVPFEKVEKTFDPNRVSLIVSVGFNDMNELRRQRSFQAKEKGYRLDTYVHPSVRRNDGVTIGENCIILDFTSIHAGSRIGDGTFIASNVNIGHDCDIGPYNYVTSGTSIAGGCKTGTGCFFGVNASLAHGITLGDRTFLGAQTMLNHNTKDDEVYVAEPGQLFRLKSQAFLRFRKVLP